MGEGSAMILIGLVGPPGVGKKTVGEYLHQLHDFIRAHNTVPSAFVRANIGMDMVVIDIVSNGEADAIRNAGGQIWLLQRPGYLTRGGDAYRGITPAADDRGLLNDGPLAALYARVDELLEDLQEARWQ